MLDHLWYSYKIKNSHLKLARAIVWGGDASIFKESATEDQHDQHLLSGVQTDLGLLQYIVFVLQQPFVEFKQDTHVRKHLEMLEYVMSFNKFNGNHLEEEKLLKCLLILKWHTSPYLELQLELQA